MFDAIGQMLSQAETPMFRSEECKVSNCIHCFNMGSLSNQNFVEIVFKTFSLQDMYARGGVSRDSLELKLLAPAL